MKIRIWFLIFLAIILIGAWLGAMMTVDPGYVLLAWRNTSIEMSLWTWLILSLLGFVVLYVIMRLLSTIGYPWHWYSRWAQAGKIQQDNKLIRLGWLALHNGDYQRAFDKLSPLALTSTQPWLVVPMLAQSEARLGNHEQAISRLRDLLSQFSNAHGLVYTTMAEIHQHNGDIDAAILALRKITVTHKNNQQANQMLLSVLQQSERWLEVIDLLRTSKAASENHAPERHAYQQAFSHLAATEPSVDKLMQLWRKAPTHVQNNKACQLAMAQSIQETETPSPHATAAFIERLMQQQWNDSLTLIYSNLPFADADLLKALNKAESWQTIAADSSALQLCLGRLCRRLKFWGKASDYFSRSISLQPNKEAHAEMGVLLQQQGDTQGALQHFRLGSVKLK